MSIADRAKIEDDIISLIKRVSGCKHVDMDQMIGRDVGVYGFDGILLAEEVEEMFDVDLNPLIEVHTTYLPPNWWDRLIGRKQGPRSTDVRVRELIDYVVLHQGTQQADKRRPRIT